MIIAAACYKLFFSFFFGGGVCMGMGTFILQFVLVIGAVQKKVGVVLWGMHIDWGVASRNEFGALFIVMRIYSVQYSRQSDGESKGIV